MGNILTSSDELEPQQEYTASSVDEILSPEFQRIIPSHQQVSESTLDGNQPANPWRDLPLHHAVATGAPTSELNRLVVHEGWDVDQQDSTGATPLHLACYFGYEHCVKWLANRGRARFIRDVNGDSPSEVARQNGYLNLAEIVDERLSEGGINQIKWGRRFIEAKKEEQLYVEMDRLQSKLAQLQASEKRARGELEREISERVKLFRSMMGGVQMSNSPSTEELALSPQTLKADVAPLDLVSDLRLQVVEFKSQRDALAAELKLVESAVSDFELLLGIQRVSTPGNVSDPPSTRLRACLRKI